MFSIKTISTASPSSISGATEIKWKDNTDFKFYKNYGESGNHEVVEHDIVFNQSVAEGKYAGIYKGSGTLTVYNPSKELWDLCRIQGIQKDTALSINNLVLPEVTLLDRSGVLLLGGAGLTVYDSLLSIREPERKVVMRFTYIDNLLQLPTTIQNTLMTTSTQESTTFGAWVGLVFSANNYDSKSLYTYISEYRQDSIATIQLDNPSLPMGKTIGEALDIVCVDNNLVYSIEFGAEVNGKPAITYVFSNTQDMFSDNRIATLNTVKRRFSYDTNMYLSPVPQNYGTIEIKVDIQPSIKIFDKIEVYLPRKLYSDFFRDVGVSESDSEGQYGIELIVVAFMHNLKPSEQFTSMIATASIVLNTLNIRNILSNISLIK